MSERETVKIKDVRRHTYDCLYEVKKLLFPIRQIVAMCNI
jgi:hypothetical protein